MIYWFTGASTQAVTTGAYRAVEFIKANIKRSKALRRPAFPDQKVVAICTKYAQKSRFLLAFAFVEPFFFIGYLFSIAFSACIRPIFLLNASGAWDNAVISELQAKSTPCGTTVIGKATNVDRLEPRLRRAQSCPSSFTRSSACSP